MIELHKQVLHSLTDWGTVGEISGVRLVDCDLFNCLLSVSDDVTCRTWVRNVEVRHCREHSCRIGPAILEDVHIEDLDTSDLLILWGTLFRRVTMSGPMGRIKLNTAITTLVDQQLREKQQAFDDARCEFYAQTDWALDIREAKFGAETIIQGIPSRLVRRNPASQLVITRERALDASWRGRVSASSKLWPFVVDLFLADGDEDRVLIAPLAGPKKKRNRLLKELDELRESGVAVPD